MWQEGRWKHCSASGLWRLWQPTWGSADPHDAVPAPGQKSRLGSSGRTSLPEWLHLHGGSGEYRQHSSLRHIRQNICNFFTSSCGYRRPRPPLTPPTCCSVCSCFCVCEHVCAKLYFLSGFSITAASRPLTVWKPTSGPWVQGPRGHRAPPDFTALPTMTASKAHSPVRPDEGRGGGMS